MYGIARSFECVRTYTSEIGPTTIHPKGSCRLRLACNHDIRLDSEQQQRFDLKRGVYTKSHSEMAYHQRKKLTQQRRWHLTSWS